MSLLISDMAVEGPDGQYVDLMVAGSRGVVTAEGLVGLEVRERVRPKPGRHGVINTTRYRDSPPVTITGHFRGVDADAVWAEYNAVAKALAAAVEVDRKLRWSGGTVFDLVETQVRLVSLKPPLEVGPDLIRYQLLLRPADPRSFAQAESVVVGDDLSASGGGKIYPYTYPRSYTLAGGGNADLAVGGTDTTPPTFRIHGSCSNPRLVLATTDDEIRIDGSVGVGRYLEVDVAEREVRLDDGTVRNNLLDFANTTWFELSPGPDTVQMFASTFDANAHVEVRWRDAYA